VRRARPWLVCPHRTRPGSDWTSHDIPIPSGYSTLEAGLAILEHLIRDHHAVVTATEIGPDGTGSYIVRIPGPPRRAEDGSDPAVPT